MGKGIATAFKTKWPEMHQEYRELCKDGLFSLGDVFVWADEGVTVFNLATQPGFRGGATLEAVRISVRSMIKRAEEEGIRSIALPRVGAGLGGLEWTDVKMLLVELGSTTQVELFVVEQFVQGESPTQI